MKKPQLPPGHDRDAVVRRAKLKPPRMWMHASCRQSTAAQVRPRLNRQKFFFDMKNGGPDRNRVGIEYNTNSKAIRHSKETTSQDVRENSLRDGQDLESPWR